MTPEFRFNSNFKCDFLKSCKWYIVNLISEVKLHRKIQFLWKNKNKYKFKNLKLACSNYKRVFFVIFVTKATANTHSRMGEKSSSKSRQSLQSRNIILTTSTYTATYLKFALSYYRISKFAIYGSALEISVKKSYRFYFTHIVSIAVIFRISSKLLIVSL